MAPEVDGLATEAGSAATMTREAINIVELHAAMRMVADRQAFRVTLVGFPWQPDQVSEIVAAAREDSLQIIPTIAYGGGAVDIVVSRVERSGD